jgi:hypothetical protein
MGERSRNAASPPARANPPQQQPQQQRRRPRQRSVAKPAVHTLKTRLRDLERGLRGAAALPANVRITHEREAAALRASVADAARQARRRKRVARYHMVRFFERKKAAKALRRAEKECAEAGAGGAGEEVLRRLDERVRRARVDLNYAVYSPLEWKYCALWPKVKREGAGEAEGKGEDGAEDEEARDMEEDVGDEQHNTVSEPPARGDPVMWERVRKATEEGQKALERLRDSSTSNTTSSGGVAQKSQPREPKEPKSERKRKPNERTADEKSVNKKTKLEPRNKKHLDRQNQEDQNDEESDGGFFE